MKVVYHCENGCKPTRDVREHDDSSREKRRSYFEKYDLGKVREIESKEIPHWYPRHRMMNVEDDAKPWGAEWREGRGISEPWPNSSPSEISGLLRRSVTRSARSRILRSVMP